MTRSSHLTVEAIGLVKTFGATRAVDGIDLSIPAGTGYGVLGPNGAGKTSPSPGSLRNRGARGRHGGGCANRTRLAVGRRNRSTMGA